MLQGNDEDVECPPRGPRPRIRMDPYRSHMNRQRSRRGRQSRPRADSGAPRGKSQLSSGSGELSASAQTNEGYSNENSSEQGNDEDVECPLRGPRPRIRMDPYRSHMNRQRLRRGRQSRPRADSGAPRGKSQLSSGSGELSASAQTNEGYSNENSSEQGNDEDVECPPRGPRPRIRMDPYRSHMNRQRSRRGRQSRPRADSGAPRGKSQLSSGSGELSASAQTNEGYSNENSSEQGNDEDVECSPRGPRPRIRMDPYRSHMNRQRSRRGQQSRPRADSGAPRGKSQLSSGSGELSASAQTNEGYSNENSSEQGSDEDVECPPRGPRPRIRMYPYRSHMNRQRSHQGRQSRPRADSGAPRGKSQLSSGSGELSASAQTNEGYSNENSSEQIMDTDEGNIDSLPDEMLIHIFTYLSQNKLGQIARVCKRWNAVTKSPVLWKEVIIKLHESHISQTTVALSVAAILPKLVTSLKLTFLLTHNWKRDWTELDYQELVLALKDKCPNLHMLTIENGKLDPSFPSIIKLCTEFFPYLNYLKFSNSRFSESSLKQFSNTSEIEALYLPYCKLEQFNNPPFSRMPRLKKLSLKRAEWDGTFYNDPSFFEQLSVLDLGYVSIRRMILQDIKQHGVNLKELYLCVTRVNDSFFRNSSFPHLETICLRECRYVTVEGFAMLFQSAQCLKNVYVLPKMAELCKKHPFLVENNRSQIINCVVSCKSHVF